MNIKRGSIIVSCGLLCTLAVGCGIYEELEDNSLPAQYNYETLYKKEDKYKVREQERATLGDSRSILDLFGKVTLTEVKPNIYKINDFSGIKGVNTYIELNKDKKTVKKIEFKGNYKEWKKKTDEKYTWENFLYDFRRLGAYNFETILSAKVDSSVSEEIVDFMEKFFLDNEEYKDKKRKTRVVHINDNLKVSGYIEWSKKDSLNEIGIVLEDNTNHNR